MRIHTQNEVKYVKKTCIKIVCTAPEPNQSVIDALAVHEYEVTKEITHMYFMGGSRDIGVWYVSDASTVKVLMGCLVTQIMFVSPTDDDDTELERKGVGILVT